MLNSKLILGDCLEVMRNTPPLSVDMILSDIPYGEVSQKSGGLRKLDRGDADTCSIDLDEMVEQCVRLMRGSAYIFCGTGQISHLIHAFKSHGLTTRVGVWEKSNPSPMNGQHLWLSGLEFCVFARKPNATFNESCKKALWKFPSGTSTEHPTEKPLPLLEYLIRVSSNHGDTVLDFTMGSGTTGIAALSMGRKFIGVEINPDYYDLAKNRIEANTLSLW